MSINKNKITCTLTGITVRVAPKTFDERATKFGSVDNLVANYVSAQGRRLLRQGQSPADIRLSFNVPDTVPFPSQDTLTKYTRWAKYSGKSKQVLEPVQVSDNSISDVK